MSTLSYTEFQHAFHGVMALERRSVQERSHAVGGSRGVGLDLVLASFNADLIYSAALQLAYVDGNAEFDGYSLSCLRCFLAAILGTEAAAETWIGAAFQHLRADGVTSCTTTHDGFSLRLLQQKPYHMFLLTATDDEADDEAPKAA